MFSSLRSRLWLTYALLIVTALAVVAVIFFIYLLSNPLVVRETGLKLSVVETAMLNSQDEWSDLPSNQLQSTLTAKDQQLGARLLIISPQRQIIADSRAGSAPSLEVRPVFRLLRLSQTIRDANGDLWVYVYHKLNNGNFLVSAVPRPSVSLLAVLTDEFLPPLLQGGIVALVMALFLAFWVARWVADPLQRVVNAAREYPNVGPKTLPLTGPSEVRALVNAFNQMTQRVEASQQSQRDFVANVSHELKTPLTSVQGFAQAILDGTASTAQEQHQSAQIIYSEAARMYRMVLDLLDLARLDAGTADLKRAQVDLNALLQNLVERFSLQARQANVNLTLESTPLPSILGDGDRLAQVFSNLVDNAFKFTPAGGRIALRSRMVEGFAEVQIADTGAGIPQEALARIFDRFYQADPARKGGKSHGAGLGLAIVQQIVRAHGGKISVHSVVGQGSVFSVRLPIPLPDAITIAQRKK